MSFIDSSLSDNCIHIIVFSSQSCAFTLVLQTALQSLGAMEIAGNKKGRNLDAIDKLSHTGPYVLYKSAQQDTIYLNWNQSARCSWGGQIGDRDPVRLRIGLVEITFSPIGDSFAGPLQPLEAAVSALPPAP